MNEITGRDANLLQAVRLFVEERAGHVEAKAAGLLTEAETRFLERAADLEKRIADVTHSQADVDQTRRELEALGKSLAEERETRVREASIVLSDTASNLTSWLEKINAPS